MITVSTTAERTATTATMVYPTENPTDPIEGCFTENLRTNGAVLKQVAFTSDKACEELCLAIEGFVFHRELTQSLLNFNH